MNYCKELSPYIPEPLLLHSLVQWLNMTKYHCFIFIELNYVVLFVALWASYFWETKTRWSINFSLKANRHTADFRYLIPKIEYPKKCNNEEFITTLYLTITTSLKDTDWLFPYNMQTQDYNCVCRVYRRRWGGFVWAPAVVEVELIYLWLTAGLF